MEKKKNYYYEWVLSSREKIDLMKPNFQKKIKFYDDLENHIKKLKNLKKI